MIRKLCCLILAFVHSAAGQQCSSDEFSITYEANAVFTVGRNGTCACNGRLSGNGASLSGLEQNPVIANYSAWLARLESQQAQGGQGRAGFASTTPIVCNSTNVGALYLNGTTLFVCTSGGLMSVAGGTQPAGSCTASCMAIKRCTGTTADGTYSITPSTGDTFSVYCDMNSDGGGWTLIARRAGGGGAGQLPLNTADWNQGTMSPFADGKLSDSRINAIRSLASMPRAVYRVVGNVEPNGRRYYARGSSTAFSSTAMGASLGGTRLSCVSQTYAACNWGAQTFGSLDTYSEWGTAYQDDSCQRFFSYLPCYSYGNNGQGLCINSGATCTGFTGSAYPPLTFTLWTREDDPSPATHSLTTSLAASCTRSCYTIKQCLPSAPDGFYMITPSAGDTYQVWCDHNTDGGGWTLVARRLGGSPAGQLPTSNFDWFQHTLSPSSDGKLSDARINALRSLSGSAANAYYRLVGNLEPTGRRLYIRGLATSFNAAIMGATFGGSRQECVSTSLAGCGAWTSTTLGYLDTYSTVVPTDDTCRRFFSYNPCYSHGNNGQGLCINSGNSCTGFTGSSYPAMTFQIWTREQ